MLWQRSDRWDVESSGGRNFAHWWELRREQAYAREARRELHDVDNWACPVGPHFVAQISPFSVDSGAFSIVGRIRDESAVGSHGEIYRGWGAGTVEKKREAGRVGGAVRKKGGATGGTSNLPGGVTLRTGGATPRAAYAREARRELHDVDNWCLPRWATFRGPNFAVFRLDSGAVIFRSFGRIRDESAVGVSWGDIQGLGCAERSRKSGKLDGWGGAVRKKGVQHEDFPGAERQVGRRILPGGVTLRTGGATPRAAYAREARRELHDVDNWACPVGPHFVAQISPFSVDSGAFSIVGRIRDESAVGSHGEIYRGWGARNGREKSGKLDGWEEQFRKKGCNTRTSQGVTHPSTTLAQATLNFREFLMGSGGTSNLPGGVTLRTGGATPASSLCTRSSPRAPPTWTTGLAPLGHISWPKFSPFSVDSGAFSIVGRIRDESAVGSHGEIYRGWGARNGREKREAGRVGGAVRKKGCNTRTSQGVTHPTERQVGRRIFRGGVTLRTGGATPRAAYAREARRELHDVDNWACPRWATFRGPNFGRFPVDSGAFSIVGRIRDESGRGVSWGDIQGLGCAERSRKSRKLDGGATGGTSNLPGGVTLRTGGATPRAAYAREARRELHDVDNWACPVGPHFVAQISPFSVDSGAFSIVGRIRDESAVGVSWGDIQGLGVRGTVEKKREAGRVGGAVRKKGCNTRTSQGVTHPSTTLAQARLTSEVLMGSGALVLV
ncbi:UNVERIFIED_CONTAM: hypothetical protein Sindi_2921300 [Sesamum indicum]